MLRGILRLIKAFIGQDFLVLYRECSIRTIDNHPIPSFPTFRTSQNSIFHWAESQRVPERSRNSRDLWGFAGHPTRSPASPTNQCRISAHFDGKNHVIPQKTMKHPQKNHRRWKPIFRTIKWGWLCMYKMVGWDWSTGCGGFGQHVSSCSGAIALRSTSEHSWRMKRSVFLWESDMAMKEKTNHDAFPTSMPFHETPKVADRSSSQQTQLFQWRNFQWPSKLGHLTLSSHLGF